MPADEELVLGWLGAGGGVAHVARLAYLANDGGVEVMSRLIR